MTYEIRKNYGAEGITRLSTEYNQSWIEREIKNAKEDMEIIRHFIALAEPHLETVKKTSFTVEVSIDKEKNYSTNHINYRVNVYRYPNIPGGDKHKIFDFYNEGKIFPRGDGPTRKAAFQYARTLAIKHACKIVGNVADQINPDKDTVAVIRL